MVFVAETECLDTDVNGFRRQNTKHGTFAVIAGQSGNTEIDLLAIDFSLNSAVLREASFRNVHSGQDFHSCKHRSLHMFWDCISFDANTVNTIAYPDAVGHWFEVNIACLHSHGFVNHHIDEPDDRTIIIVTCGFGLENFRFDGMAFGGKFRGCGVNTASDVIDASVYESTNFCGAGQAAFELAVEPETQSIKHVEVERVADKEFEPAVFFGHGQDTILLDDFLRNKFHCFL
ncbi:MAG: hypothetical protein BWY69_00678 [Planctomycetes bacterium ADurb.Bin401]|nr:MAG: hypothetical protein BWY69_00678 [Planctomycetes bacterium ADurb.Bin401]